MPTYEYHCDECGHEFETVQSMSAEPLKNCPKELCARKKWGRGRVTKKISGGSGLLFKGSGFYITDYRSQKYKDAAKKESAPASGAKPASDAKPAKSESKPASASTASTKK